MITRRNSDGVRSIPFPRALVLDYAIEAIKDRLPHFLSKLLRTPER